MGRAVIREGAHSERDRRAGRDVTQCVLPRHLGKLSMSFDFSLDLDYVTFYWARTVLVSLSVCRGSHVDLNDWVDARLELSCTVV